MKGRRLVGVALLAMGALPGCASWCSRNYPCQQPVAYAQPAACCCPAPTGPVAPVCAPTSYSPTWNQPTAAPVCPPCR